MSVYSKLTAHVHNVKVYSRSVQIMEIQEWTYNDDDTVGFKLMMIVCR